MRAPIDPEDWLRRYKQKIKWIDPHLVVRGNCETYTQDVEKIESMVKWLRDNPEKDFPPIIIVETYNDRVATANGCHRHIAYLEAKRTRMPIVWYQNIDRIFDYPW